MNYKVLYIYKHEPMTGALRFYSPNKYFWTMCSDDTEYCKSYREKAQVKYCGEILEEIAKIECKDAKACKELQLNINEIFKPWADNKMKLKLDISDSQFLGHIRDLINGNCNVECLLSKYDHNTKNGFIYLAKCTNNKLKIGYATDINRRLEELKNEERNQVIDIIDMFESVDIKADEAKLHELCDKYKTNSNKEVTWLQDCGNSELFKDCQEVINIWSEYKVNRDIRNNDVTM